MTPCIGHDIMCQTIWSEQVGGGFGGNFCSAQDFVRYAACLVSRLASRTFLLAATFLPGFPASPISFDCTNYVHGSRYFK